MARGSLLHVAWMSVAAFAAVATAARQHSERASSQDHARSTAAGKEGKVTRTQGGLAAGIAPVYHDDFEAQDSPDFAGLWDVRTTRQMVRKTAQQGAQKRGQKLPPSTALRLPNLQALRGSALLSCRAVPISAYHSSQAASLVL